jgi:hypothetical protein
MLIGCVNKKQVHKENLRTFNRLIGTTGCLLKRKSASFPAAKQKLFSEIAIFHDENEKKHDENDGIHACLGRPAPVG